jgi:hypothetical protein
MARKARDSKGNFFLSHQKRIGFSEEKEEVAKKTAAVFEPAPNKIWKSESSTGSNCTQYQLRKVARRPLGDFP